MKEAVIVAACRTAVGGAPWHAEGYAPEHMATTVLADVVKRRGTWILS